MHADIAGNLVLENSQVDLRGVTVGGAVSAVTGSFIRVQFDIQSGPPVPTVIGSLSLERSSYFSPDGAQVVGDVYCGDGTFIVGSFSSIGGSNNCY